MPPKRKLTRPRTRRRYATFRARAVRKLDESTQIQPCPRCGSPRKLHHLCPTCGGYGAVTPVSAPAKKGAKKGAKNPDA